jgi:hypothetical protein
MSTNDKGLGLIEGAANIAAFLGPEVTERRVYYLHEIKALGGAIFKVGDRLAARAERLRAEVAKREQEAAETS